MGSSINSTRVNVGSCKFLAHTPVIWLQKCSLMLFSTCHIRTLDLAEQRLPSRTYLLCRAAQICFLVYPLAARLSTNDTTAKQTVLLNRDSSLARRENDKIAGEGNSWRSFTLFYTDFTGQTVVCWLVFLKTSSVHCNTGQGVIGHT